jgi:Family of unknown function (DUF6495)
MKYRRLSLTELEQVQGEFIEFLALNGIPAEDWQKLKTKPKDVDDILNSFSDAWFEMYLRKIEYLITDLSSELMCFQCNENSITMVGLNISQDADATLDIIERIRRSIESDSCEVYTQTKNYTQVRELELFSMIEKGAKVSDGSLFKRISLGLG